MVIQHGDWSTPALDLRPVAPDTGPFPRRDFLEALWNYAPAGDLCLTETSSALVPLVVGEAGLHWVGPPDLVDYRSPLGDDAADLIAEVMATSASGLHYRFDSLPDEAADVVRRGLAKAGLPAEPVRVEVAARLPLPNSFEVFLERVGSKERHEIRRKRRRFREAHGDPVVITSRGTGAGFERFVEMHRASGGGKGSFLTPRMQTLFAALADQDGWAVELLCGEETEPVASAFAWADADGYYLYNSAFDRLSTGSPGIVLVSMLIERAIQRGCRVFDFLKGDEPYKFRLGAVSRLLYGFEGST